MSNNFFIIKKKEGILFSKISGDTNKIHTDSLTGYNSIFAEEICHASLIIIETAKTINLQKLVKKFKAFSFSIKFYKHFCYEKKIIIKKKIKNKKIFIELVQFNEIRASIILEDINKTDSTKFAKVSKIFKINDTLTSSYNVKNNIGKMSILLCILTKYVGTINPGENSIINSININFNNFFNFDKNNIKVYSKKLDKRLPIILNKLNFQDFNIEFKTSQRPKLKVKLGEISKNIKNYIHKLNRNILIIGGSTGIGFDVLNILKINKRLKIIATYNRNKININDKNIIKIKLNLKENIYLLKRILKKFSPLVIYYFATPKIEISQNNENKKKIYKEFYVNYPLKILSFCKNEKINFFYPSTVFVDQNMKSIYSKMKKIGEDKLKKINKKNLKINICRLDEINTKQNLSLIKKNLPNFRDLLNDNKSYQKKFFFN